MTTRDGHWKPVLVRRNQPTFYVRESSYAGANVLPVGIRVDVLERDGRFALAPTNNDEGWAVSANHNFAFGAVIRKRTNLNFGRYALTQDGERWIIGERLDGPA